MPDSYTYIIWRAIIDELALTSVHHVNTVVRWVINPVCQENHCTKPGSSFTMCLTAQARSHIVVNLRGGGGKKKVSEMDQNFCYHYDPADTFFPAA